jgi:ribonuclease R
VSRALSDENLLAHIRKLPHARATYKQLVKEFRATGDDREKLESALERLSGRGDLVEMRSGHFIAVGDNPEYLSGRVSLHRDGYGFLVPERPVENMPGDVFLPPDEAQKAMHGDRAIVHVTRRAPDGRAEGAIVRIVGRAHLTVVGEFRVRRRGNFVRPSDERIQQWIEIPEGMEFPPRRNTVDRVGASIREVNTIEDLDGMIVNVELLEFPEGDEAGVGRVLEILGYPDDFGVDVEIVIRKHHLPHEFPPDAIEQARRIPHEIPPPQLGRRRDFRALEIVTIDGETARDFDDAVWVERLPNGNFALQVHIADVSHYVKPGTPIDVEAQLRGTSVYFPDRAVPMLPVELSTDICSLRPEEDRLVLSALLEIDPKGDVVSDDFCRGVIRSAARMTYTNVYRILEGDAAMRSQYASLVDRFELMRDLAL